MITHNICFRREIRKILHVCGYPLLSVAMFVKCHSKFQELINALKTIET